MRSYILPNGLVVQVTEPTYIRVKNGADSLNYHANRELTTEEEHELKEKIREEHTACTDC